MKEKIQELQSIEQNLQSLATQHHGLRSQLLESESALKELETTEEAFKIVANIMVRQPKEKLIKEIKEKDVSLRSRLKQVQDQESTLQEKARKLQEEIMKVKE